MKCPSLKAVASADRPRLKPVKLRMVFTGSGELGAMLTGLLNPGLSLTLPRDPSSIDLGELAEALCCASRASLVEVLFNVATAVALIVGSATGVREAILVGLAGMIVTLIQYLAKLAGSRRLCKATRSAIAVAGLVRGLALEALRSLEGCGRPCRRMVAYGGLVYRVSWYGEDGGRVEVVLEPLGPA